MLDRTARKLIDPPLNAVGHRLARLGFTADGVTLLGLAFGLMAAAFIALGWMFLALVFLLLSRLADGLDGSVARATQTTDFGGYLDIACDFSVLRRDPPRFCCAKPGREWRCRRLASDKLLLQRNQFFGLRDLG